MRIKEIQLVYTCTQLNLYWRDVVYILVDSYKLQWNDWSILQVDMIQDISGKLWELKFIFWLRLNYQN